MADVQTMVFKTVQGGYVTVKATDPNLAKRLVNGITGYPYAGLTGPLAPGQYPANVVNSPISQYPITDAKQLDPKSGEFHPALANLARADAFPPGSAFSGVQVGSALGQGEEPGRNDQIAQPTQGQIEHAQQTAAQQAAESQSLQQQDEEDTSNAFYNALSTPQQVQQYQQAQQALQDKINELAGTRPDVANLIQQLLSGDFTPEELQQIVGNPAFQSLFTDPDTAEILGPYALDALSQIVQAQIIGAAGIQQQQIQSNPFGRTGAEDAALQNQLAQYGVQSPFALVASGQITPEQLQALISSQQSGGLTDQSQIFDILQQQARGDINNPFAALSSGLSLDDISQILRSGLTPEQQLQQIQAAQQAQNLQNYLNFIGNPSAVGTAVGLGYNPFSQGQVPGVPAAPGAPAAPAAPAAPPQSGVQFFGGLAGGAGLPSAIAPSPSQNSLMQQAVGGALPTRTPFNPQSLNPVLGSQVPQRATQAAPQTPFNNLLGPTQGMGSFRPVAPNANEATLRDLSDEEKSFYGGQQAARGVTPSGLLRRVRSFTPGGQRQAVASGF